MMEFGEEMRVAFLLDCDGLEQILTEMLPLQRASRSYKLR
jgi:hypothetical protein